MHYQRCIIMNEQVSYTKKDYKKAGKEIYEKLHLSTYPIGIKYLKEGDKPIKGLTRPSFTGDKASQGLPQASVTKKLSICQAFTMSRTSGISYMLTIEDNFCIPSSILHGWTKLSEEDLIQSQIMQGWHKDEESERRKSESRNRVINHEELLNKADKALYTSKNNGKNISTLFSDL